MRLQFKQFIENPAYDNDAGLKFWGNQAAGVLPLAKDTGNLLVGLRSPAVNEGRTWGVFGGAIEENENPATGAKREMAEEIGWSGAIQMIPAYKFEKQGFSYQNFIGIVEHEFEAGHLNWEVTMVEWMTYQQLLALRPKHFGLEALLKNSGSQIENLIKQMQPRQENQPIGHSLH